MSLIRFLEEQSALHGPRLVVQYRPQYRTIRWRYDDLTTHVHVLADILAATGVGHGDRILLCCENSPYWVAGFFATVQLGAVVVPINPRTPRAQLDRLVASAQPKQVLHSLRTPWRGLPLPSVILETSCEHEPSHLSPGPTSSFPLDTLAEIIYTSGTTGEPKGVMLSHGNLLADLEGVSRAITLQPSHHVLSVVPLFHVYGQMTSMFCPLRGGCAATYLANPTSRALLEALTHTPATHLVAVPAVLKTLMERLETRMGRIPGWLRPVFARRIRRRLSKTLEILVCGGASLDPVLEEKWRDLGFEVLQGYGLTETSPVIAANTPTAHRLGSVGKPLDNAEIRIAEDGEILVRGPMVMQGYYQDTARTKAAFTNGWLKTDDGGYFDADGFLYVEGRRKYMILGPGGENVFPEDLESELNRVAGVRDSAVVGLDRDGRTIIHAVLLCEPERAANAVAEANRHLAPHQHIMSWSVWPEADFPRAVTRKVKKEEVLRWLSGQRGEQPPVERQITRLARLLCELTHCDPATISATTRLVGELGLDSLLRIELVSRIEDEWGVYLDETMITPELTLAELETAIEQGATTPTELSPYPRWSLSPWARALRPVAQRLFLQWWIAWCCRCRVEGLEHLADLPGPVIFMANHRSYLDSGVIAFALPPRFRWRLGIAASTEVLYRRFRWAVPLGELAMNSFPFPTSVQENIRPGLDYLGRLLDDGFSVLIFPEGRINRGDQPLQELKSGTGVIAVEMRVPIVPVTLSGTEYIMPPDTILPRARGSVTVRFGPPLRLPAGAGHAEATALIQRILETQLTGQQ